MIFPHRLYYAPIRRFLDAYARFFPNLVLMGFNKYYFN